MMTGRLCCSMNGFSLHAATAINTHNRKGLERLISYIARGPFSNERLELVEDRKVKLSLKRAYADGTVKRGTRTKIVTFYGCTRVQWCIHHAADCP